MKERSVSCEVAKLNSDSIESYLATRSILSLETFAEFIRRTFDIAVSLFVLILFSPVILMVGILIRLTSPGPALFWQKRVGRNRRSRDPQQAYSGTERRKHNFGGQLFWFVKFRTMYIDARERFPHLYRYEYSPDEIKRLRFKVRHDPRHTRLGRRLRIWTIDELPNFWNTLTGSMTLVGPRPDIPEMTRYYQSKHLRIFEVKPGITGYAQINGRCNLKFKVTKALDLQYVEDRSLRVDFLVMMATVLSVLRGYGAF